MEIAQRFANAWHKGNDAKMQSICLSRSECHANPNLRSPQRNGISHPTENANNDEDRSMGVRVVRISSGGRTGVSAPSSVPDLKIRTPRSRAPTSSLTLTDVLAATLV